MLIRNVKLPNDSLNSIRVTNGIIATVAPNLAPEQGEEIIEGGGCYALPGAIDMHVHGRIPGGEHKEDYEHLIAAALAGGVVAAAVMPNTNPPLETVELVEQQIKAAAAVNPAFRLMVNVGISSGNFEQLRSCLDMDRVHAIKMYETSTTGVDAQPDDVFAWKVLAFARERGVPVMVHAQDESEIRRNKKKFGGKSASDHYRIQNLAAEIVAVRRYLRLSMETDAEIVICHVSSADTLPMIAEFNAKYGKKVYTEAAPHYFRMDTSWLDLSDGTLFQMNPSLRESEQRAWMERMLTDPEMIDYVATDHAPHTLEEKLKPYGQAPSGVPGIQTMLPLLWDSGRKYDMPMRRFVELTSRRAAEIYNIAGYGEIAAGVPAHIVIFDPNAEHIIRNEDMKSKCGWTPYNGWKVRGKMMLTILRDKIAFSQK